MFSYCSQCLSHISNNTLFFSTQPSCDWLSSHPSQSLAVCLACSRHSSSTKAVLQVGFVYHHAPSPLKTLCQNQPHISSPLPPQLMPASNLENLSFGAFTLIYAGVWETCGRISHKCTPQPPADWKSSASQYSIICTTQPCKCFRKLYRNSDYKQVLHTVGGHYRLHLIRLSLYVSKKCKTSPSVAFHDDLNPFQQSVWTSHHLFSKCVLELVFRDHSDKLLTWTYCLITVQLICRAIMLLLLGRLNIPSDLGLV